MTPKIEVDGLVESARAGQPRAVARLISLIEDGSPYLRTITEALCRPGEGRRPGAARVVGLTGSPGVGKSTCTSGLVRAYRARGARVGVLAVDPSSPFTGGALLGDRVRMQDHATDEGVFIRSMASRGHLGGLAWATPHALRVLDAAGCDVVLVETVGVGQAEVEIASMADSTVVITAPGMGDSVQAAKAGILEVADVFVVNKADRDGAHAAVRDLRNMVALAERGPDDWKPPIVSTVAVKDEGIEELVAKLDAHERWLLDTGGLARRRRGRARQEIEAIAVAALRARMVDVHGDKRLDEVAQQVAAGALDPYAAADGLVGDLSAPQP